jgi:hypothetical protein
LLAPTGVKFFANAGMAETDSSVKPHQCSQNAVQHFPFGQLFTYIHRPAELLARWLNPSTLAVNLAELALPFSRMTPNRRTALHLPLSSRSRLRVWANVNAPATEHKMHATRTISSPVSTMRRRPPLIDLTAYNTDWVVVVVRTGTLILFPAWLSHSVDANQSERSRISISFNAMFIAFADTLSQPSWGEP